MLLELDDYEGYLATVNQRRNEMAVAPLSAGSTAAARSGLETAAGRLEVALANPQRAEEHYRRAERLALEAQQPELLVSAQVGLATALRDLGDWDQATGKALDALAVSRLGGRLTGLDRPARLRMQQSALRALMLTLSASKQARLTHTLYVEAAGVLVAPPETAAAAEWQYLLGYALLRCGHVDSSATVLRRLQAHAAAQGSTPLSVETAFLAGALALSSGDFEGACGSYAAAHEVALVSGPPWNAAAAVTDYGWVLLRKGDVGEALDKLATASTLWRTLRHSRFEGLVSCYQAEAELRAGQRSRALEHLAVANDLLGLTPSKYWADLARASAVLLRDAGEASGSLEAYVRAAHLRRVHRSWVTLAVDVRELSQLAEASPPMSGANQLELAKCEAELEQFARDEDRWVSPDQQAADLQNGLGVLALDVQLKDPVSGLERAERRFRAAVELDPQNVWYRLNVAFCLVRRQHWLPAAEAFRSLATVTGPLPKQWYASQAQKYELLARRKTTNLVDLLGG